MRWERQLAVGGSLVVQGFQVLLKTRPISALQDAVLDISWWSADRMCEFLRAHAVGGFDTFEQQMLRERLGSRVVPAWASMLVRDHARTEEVEAALWRLTQQNERSVPQGPWEVVRHGRERTIEVRHRHERVLQFLEVSDGLKVLIHSDSGSAVQLAFGAVCSVLRDDDSPVPTSRCKTMVALTTYEGEEHECAPLLDKFGLANQLEVLGLPWPLPHENDWCSLGALCRFGELRSKGGQTTVIDF